MDDTCDYCDKREPEWTYQTEGRGWKFVCKVCYWDLTELLKSYLEVYIPTRYYPRYDYTTRKVI